VSVCGRRFKKILKHHDPFIAKHCIPTSPDHHGREPRNLGVAIFGFSTVEIQVTSILDELEKMNCRR
jgi:hypothetical protein